MINASASGLSIFVVALTSFPGGFSVTSFPDDADPINIDDLEAVKWEPLATGDGYFYVSSELIRVSVSVIGGTQDDTNLQMMLQARKSMNAVLPLPDITALTINYPDGAVAVYSDGSIISGPLGRSAQMSGRYRSNTYHFGFNQVKLINLTSPLAILQTASQFF
jgi:hypothetical protein